MRFDEIGSRKMKLIFQSIIIASLFLTGCSLSTVKNPKIINHPEPNYFQDTMALEKAGCTSDGSNRDWNCDPKGSLGCWDVILL